MEELLLQIIIIAYGGVGVIGLIAYWPTIKDLYHHKRASANATTFMIWTATASITFLYSLFILPDLLFRVVSGLNFIACLIVLSLCIRLKIKRP